MTNVIHKNIAMAQRLIAGFVALILGEKTKIVWGQNAACDIEGTIQLPRPKTGDVEEVALLTRLAVHEAGHHKHTDFSKLDGLNGSEFAVLNALEDPRMEGEQIKAFPGASLILNRGLEGMLKSISAKMDASDPANLPVMVMMSILIRGYLQVAPHQAFRELGKEMLAGFEPHVGESTRQAVEQAVKELPSCKNTSDTIALAQRLVVAMRPPKQEETPAPEHDESIKDQQSEDDQVGVASAEPDSPKSDESGQTTEEGVQPDSSKSSDEALAKDNLEGEACSQVSQQDANEPDQDDAGNERPEQCGNTSIECEMQEGGAGSQKCDEQGHGGGDTPTGDSSQVQETEGHQKAGLSDEPATEASDGQMGTDTTQPQGGGTSEAPDQTEPDQIVLSEVQGNDLGGLLMQTYIEKYGTPEIYSPDAAPADQQDFTESTGAVTKALAVALEQAAQNGESLEQAMRAATEELDALERIALTGAEEGSIDGDETIAIAIASAGGGNASGQPVQLDHSIRLNGVISRLVRVFLKEFQDTRRRPMKYAQAGGQIAANRVWRMKRLGDTNVFRVRKPMAGIDAAVKILLDRSGSMRRDIRLAAEVSLACSQALERISKVKISIDMFPGPEGTTESTSTLQKFGEPARQAAKRCSEVDASGGTPLAEALRESMPGLLSQRCEKRVLIVITDGDPNNREAAKLEISNAEKQGVEVMGIGIGDDCNIAQLIQFSTHINDVSELPDALEKLFSSYLVQKLAA